MVCVALTAAREVCESQRVGSGAGWVWARTLVVACRSLASDATAGCRAPPSNAACTPRAHAQAPACQQHVSSMSAPVQQACTWPSHPALAPPLRTHHPQPRLFPQLPPTLRLQPSFKVRCRRGLSARSLARQRNGSGTRKGREAADQTCCTPNTMPGRTSRSHPIASAAVSKNSSMRYMATITPALPIPRLLCTATADPAGCCTHAQKQGQCDLAAGRIEPA
eukprot:2121704-Rhodomonas_salina.2